MLAKMIWFPFISSYSVFLSHISCAGQNSQAPNCHRESAQHQYQTPTVISSLSVCKQTQQREYEFFLICATEIFKFAFLHLSAVPVFLSNMRRQLLKYPPKSTPPKWHLGYGTSCITHFSITWQDTQDSAYLSWNKFTRHKEKWFWVSSS